MDAVGTIASLKTLLIEMEADLGLAALTENERDLLYAAILTVPENKDVVRSRDLREHPLTQGMSVPTFHRVLRALMDKGYLDHAPNTLARSYRILRRI